MGNKYYLVGFFLFFTLCIQPSLAQKKLERQIKKLDLEADQLYESMLWKEALELYLVLDSVSPGNSEYQFRIGVIYYHSVDKAKSLDYFLESVKNGKKDPKLNYYLGRAYHFNIRFDSAVSYYRKALQVPDSVAGLDKKQRFEIEKHIQDCQLAAKYIEDPLLIPINNIGEPINSLFPEYVPLVSADESKLIFTSRRPSTTGKGVDAQGAFMEDIYISYKDKNGIWSEPDNNLNFNTPEHDACVGLSPDGNTLILYRSDNGGDLYLSRFDGKTWLDPEPLVGVNTTHWESSACFSADSKYIYFTSDKPGGYGGSDIYRAELLSGNKYGNFQNLGPEINTEYDEDAPQIHSDGKTLFFSSKGHHGLGGYDIYSSVFNENTDKWETPRNIGYPINTPDDDIYFTLLSNGTKGYFSSYRNDSYGEKDIYLISRPESVSTRFLMKFKLFDHFQNRPIQARISIRNKKTDQTIVLSTADTIQGKYAVPMDFETDYILGIEAEGYQFKEKIIQMDYRADIFEYVMDIVPKKEEVIVLMDSMEYMDALKRNGTDLVEEPEKTLPDSNGFLTYKDLDSMPVNQPSYELRDSEDKIPTYVGSENNSAVKKPSAVNERKTNHLTDQPETVFVSNSPYTGNPDPSVTGEMKDLKKDLLESIDILAEIENIKSIMQKKSEVILLTRSDPRDKLVLPMINFPYNSYSLSVEQNEEITHLAEFLVRNKQIHLIIFGHTDSKGKAEYNQWLSDKRANAVREALLKNNVNQSQVHITGLGEDYPLMSNDSDMGRMVNRRASMQFIDTFDQKYLKTPYDSLISRFNILITDRPAEKSQLLVWEKLPVTVHFSVNNAESITEYSHSKLKMLVEYINSFPVNLVISGFEDMESENAGLDLSNKRAYLVQEELIRLGISQDKLIIMDKREIENLFDIKSFPKGLQRQRVQFFTVRD